MSTPAATSLPPDNTICLFIDYQNAISAHTMLVRVVDSFGPTAYVTEVQAFLNALEDIIGASTITGVRRRNKNAHVSFPIGSTLVGTTFGDGPVTMDTNAVALSFVGRTPNGSRAKVSVFGYHGSISAYRLTPTEFGPIGTAVDALQGATDGFIAIDGARPQWYRYADIKANNYWVRRARG